MTCADRELAPTPLSADGSPLVDRPAWVADVEACTDPARATAAARARWERWPQLPALGEPRRVDGVDLISVTFACWDDPCRADEAVMLHLDSLTDRHRTHIAPALLRRVGATPLRQLTYRLPVDGCYSYRLVHRADLPEDVGATRSGWLQVHRDGRPDPRNPHRLPHPHGSASSVWSGPRFTPHPAWGSAAAPAGGQHSWLDVPVTGADGVPRAHQATRVGAGGTEGAARPLLVMFDRHIWCTLPLLPALHARGRDVDVLLVDTLGGDQRAHDLPHPERAAVLVHDALAAGCARLGRDAPAAEHVIVAGQSFGGLAAAGLAVHHPDVAATAIVQSGSFWFSAQGSRPELYRAGPSRSTPTPPLPEATGDLVTHLRDRARASPPTTATARLVVQVGRDEDDMVDGARAFRDAARSAGHAVTYVEYRGGHDYAWWRHGLLDALDDLATRDPR